jgi:hypothetical protein
MCQLKACNIATVFGPGDCSAKRGSIGRRDSLVRLGGDVGSGQDKLASDRPQLIPVKIEDHADAGGIGF